MYNKQCCLHVFGDAQSSVRQWLELFTVASFHPIHTEESAVLCTAQRLTALDFDRYSKRCRRQLLV